MRIIFSVFLALFLLPIQTIHAENICDDLKANHAYFPSFQALIEKEVFSGYEDGSCKPDHVLNRVEALKIILRSTGQVIIQEIDTSYVTFPDIEAEKWYVPYIQQALSQNIISGYEDGLFRPEKPMSRVEFIKILTNLLSVHLETGSTMHFTDVGRASWYAPYINYLVTNNFLPSDLGTNFYPDQPITRALAAEILYRAYFLGDNAINIKEPVVVETSEETPDLSVEVVEDEGVVLGDADPTDPDLQSHLIETGLDTGIASYYADRFHGQHTANGEIFDNTAMTAAHPYLPMDSIIRVTNVESGAYVDVRVNDCGPFSKGRVRVVDLTKTAFATIGSLGSGLIDVKVEVLQIPEDGKFRNYCYEITER